MPSSGNSAPDLSHPPPSLSPAAGREGSTRPLPAAGKGAGGLGPDLVAMGKEHSGPSGKILDGGRE